LQTSQVDEVEGALERDAEDGIVEDAQLSRLQPLEFGVGKFAVVDRAYRDREALRPELIDRAPVALLEPLSRVSQLGQRLGGRVYASLEEIDVAERIVTTEAQHEVGDVFRENIDLSREVLGRGPIDGA
jgi:hypothetical protein